MPSDNSLLSLKTNLRNENKTEGDGATKDDDESYDAELDIRLIPGQKRHRRADDAHDANVVHAHADVFAVVEGRDAHVPGLPRQKAAKQL